MARMPTALLHLHGAWVDIELVVNNNKLFNMKLWGFAKITFSMLPSE